MINFMDKLENEYYNGETNFSYTENGALGYKSTGTKLIDINFAVSSLRCATDTEIIGKFIEAFYENSLLSIKWLFFARDVREGLGERRLFRTVLTYLAQSHINIARAIIELVPKYGRWDDLWCLLDVPTIKKDIIDIVAAQLSMDCLTLRSNEANKSISLLAKWLPSINTSSYETVRLAKELCKGLGLSEKEYRKTLSKLRAYLNVVEVNMSAKEWDKIDYEKVPSRANLIYNGAFLKNDEERRRNFLDKLEKGEAKINSSVLFPHDIVHKYYVSDKYGYRSGIKSSTDITLEQLWKNLPDLVQGNGNTLVVADGSGSMEASIGNSNITALQVANALAIYFSEHCIGGFKDTYITFSTNPRLVNFSTAKTLREKLELASHYNEVASTNIQATFRLILKTAMDNKMTQEEIPANILIISDMEFDSATHSSQRDITLFQTIANDFALAGYKLPRLIFWNVNSTTGTIPVKENELGVALVSGFSPNVCKMVLSGECDAFKCLLSILNSERYDAIEDAIKSII